MSTDITLVSVVRPRASDIQLTDTYADPDQTRTLAIGGVSIHVGGFRASTPADLRLERDAMAALVRYASEAMAWCDNRANELEHGDGHPGGSPDGHR